MKNLNELYTKIEKILKTDMVGFMSAYRYIALDYEEKGFSINRIKMLLNGQIDVNGLEERDMIAICKALYKIGHVALNPSEFFGSLKIVSYESAVRVEKVIDKIELKNFIKKNDYEYKGYVTYKQIYDYINNTLIFYDYEAQRSPRYRKVGSIDGAEAMYIRTENINEKSIRDIADAISNNSFEDTEMVFNCEMIKGKNQNFLFESKFNDIVGDIVIKPNYEIADKNTTWVSITDGFHRCKGIMLAMAKHYKETGEYLEGSIGLRLVRVDKERAKRIVHQTFLRSADEPEWIKSVVSDDYSKFVDKVIENSKSLTVENTIEIAEIKKAITSKSLLIDIVKHTNIEVNNDSEVYYKSMDIGKNFDLIYAISSDVGAEVNVYTGALYFYIAYKMLSEKIDVVGIIEKIYLNEKIKFMFKRNVNVGKLLKTLDEVISNE